MRDWQMLEIKQYQGNLKLPDNISTAEMEKVFSDTFGILRKMHYADKTENTLYKSKK